MILEIEPKLSEYVNVFHYKANAVVVHVCTIGNESRGFLSSLTELKEKEFFLLVKYGDRVFVRYTNSPKYIFVIKCMYFLQHFLKFEII